MGVDNNLECKLDNVEEFLYRHPNISMVDIISREKVNEERVLARVVIEITLDGTLYKSIDPVNDFFGGREITNSNFKLTDIRVKENSDIGCKISALVSEH